MQLIGESSTQTTPAGGEPSRGAGAAVDHWTLPDELSQVDVAVTKASLNQR